MGTYSGSHNLSAARHWSQDADQWRPERFIDTHDYRWPREAFLGFSAGARACLGQKFAQVEGVAVLTTLLRKYEVLLKEDVDGTAPVGESRETKRQRLMQAKTVSAGCETELSRVLKTGAGDHPHTIEGLNRVQGAASRGVESIVCCITAFWCSWKPYSICYVFISLVLACSHYYREQRRGISSSCQRRTSHQL